MTEPRAATGRSGTGRSGTGAGDALRIVRAEPLTPAAFAPFGVVLEAAGPGRAVNGGTARRVDYPAPLVSTRPEARLRVARYTCTAAEGAIVVAVLERHAASSQWFLPVEPARYVVVVAPGDDAPRVDEARAFVAEAPTGIAYARGTWHAPLRVVGSDAALLCLVHEDGSAADCEEVTLGAAAFAVAIP